MINIKSNSKKLNKQQIEKLEDIVGGVFPEEYINFLKKNNGGFPENNVVASEKGPFILTSFFGTDLEPSYNLLSLIKIFEGRIPDGCVPIADDAGGNLVCINLNTNKQYGCVFFWDHEEELLYEDEGIKLENLYYIAPSFNEFLKMIKPDDIEEDTDLSGYKIKSVWVDPEFLKELKDK